MDFGMCWMDKEFHESKCRRMDGLVASVRRLAPVEALVEPCETSGHYIVDTARGCFLVAGEVATDAPEDEASCGVYGEQSQFCRYSKS